MSFLNAMICFLIVSMIQRRSYKLKTSNILLEKTIIYMTVRGTAHDISRRESEAPNSASDALHFWDIFVSLR